MKHKPSVWHCHVSQLYKEHEALYAFGICCLNIFFFLHSSSSRFPLLLTLEVSNCLKEPNPVPLSGNSLDTSIRQRGRADAWNFNQKENNEFVEFENVPLKQNAPNPLWYGKATTPLSLLHEWNYFSCLQSASPGHYDPYYMSCACERKPSTSLYLPSHFFSIYFPLRPDSTMALQLSGDPVVLGADKVLNRLWGGLEVIWNWQLGVVNHYSVCSPVMHLNPRK